MVKKMAIKTYQNKPKKWLRVSMPRFFMPMFKITLLLGLLAGSALLVNNISGVWSGILPVNKIAIVGEVEHLEQAQLAKILSTKEFSGMLSIDLQKLRNKVIQLPWVKEVQIRKIWPDTLSFSVEEFQAIAQVNQSYLTDEGVLIERGSYITSQPVLQLDIDSAHMEKGPELLILLEKLQQVQARLAKHQLQVDKVKISENNSWLIQIENKFLIKTGRKKQLERIEKFVRIYAVIKDKKLLESIDLRYSNGLAVKFSSTLSEPKNG